MRSFGLSIKNSDEQIIGRLESISYPRIGLVNYQFWGGPAYKDPQKNEVSWKNFSFEHQYSITDDDEFFSNMEIEIGDIVQFNPSGPSTIIYEKKSRSNAFLLTERCNSKCIICPQPPKDQGGYIDLCVATAQLINDEIDVIGITGGEPTVEWANLLRLLKHLGELQPDTTIELLTNARRLRQYEKVKELTEITKNRLIVCIPLYSEVHHINDLIVGVKGAFWQTIEGIYNLERLGVPIELRIVLIKQNYKRLNVWAEYVYRHFPFVQHVAIMGLEPIGHAHTNIDEVWIDPVDYAEHLSNAVKTFKRRGIEISIYNHQLCTLPQELWEHSSKSISEWKNSFFKECRICTIKKDCCGFFDSATIRRSRGVSPFLADTYS